MTVRAATADGDAQACAAVYAPYVSDTAVTFESEPPTAADVAQRILAATHRYAWLVLADNGRVIGFAYAGPYKPRPAYRWGCAVSIYLERGRRRTGGGRLLYEGLFARLAERGFRTAVAGTTSPGCRRTGRRPGPAGRAALRAASPRQHEADRQRRRSRPAVGATECRPGFGSITGTPPVLAPAGNEGSVRTSRSG